MDGVEYMGFVATGLATLAFLPQVFKTLRTWRAHDFSLVTLLMLMAGSSIWVVYGYCRTAPAIWPGNAVTLALLCIILVVKTSNISAKR